MQRILIPLLALPLALAAQPATTRTEIGNYERALERQRAAFGESSAAYASALLDLARAYQSTQERSAEAVQLYRKALPIQEATLGREHPDVAATLYYLALDAHGHGRAAEAEGLYERALAIRTKAFGVSDPKLAEILTPLAVLKNDETLYQRSLSILDAAGRSSPQTATTLEMYAKYLRGHDRAADADLLQARARQIRVEDVAQSGAGRGPAVRGPVYRINAAEGIKPPRVAQKAEPEYTDMARLSKLEGTAVLKIVVGADGLAHDIELVRGVGLGLDENAATAIAKWVFHPATKDGVPVPVHATVEVNFKLM